MKRTLCYRLLTLLVAALLLLFSVAGWDTLELLQCTEGPLRLGETCDITVTSAKKGYALSIADGQEPCFALAESTEGGGSEPRRSVYLATKAGGNSFVSQSEAQLGKPRRTAFVEVTDAEFADQSYAYDGSPKAFAVEPYGDVSLAFAYQQDGKAVPADNVTDAGVYDVTITVTNSKYPALAFAIERTLTIEEAEEAEEQGSASISEPLSVTGFFLDSEYGNRASFRYEFSDACEMHFVISPANTVNPTGNYSFPNAVVTKSSDNTRSGSITADGLSPHTEYVAFLYGDDAAEGRTPITRIYFKTGSIPPVSPDDPPQVKSLLLNGQYGNAAIFTYEFHYTCTMHFAICPGGTATPKDHTFPDAVVTETASDTRLGRIAAEGLSPHTEYVAFLYGVNANGEKSSIMRFGFRTGDVRPMPPPAPQPAVETFALVNEWGTAAEFRFVFNDSCASYFLICPGGAETPTGSYAFTDAVVTRTTVSKERDQFRVDGLSPNTDYVAFLYGVNDLGEKTAIARIDFSTGRPLPKPTRTPTPKPTPKPTPPPKSSEARLKQVTSADTMLDQALSTTFDPDVYEYYLGVDFGDAWSAANMITGTPMHAKASILSSASGKNLTLTVTAEDGVTTRSYVFILDVPPVTCQVTVTGLSPASHVFAYTGLHDLTWAELTAVFGFVTDVSANKAQVPVSCAITDESGTYTLSPTNPYLVGGVATGTVTYEERPLCTLTFDARGGTVTPASVPVPYHESTVLPAAAPPDDAHVFLGWSEDPAAVSATYLGGQSLTVEHSMDLYAVYATPVMLDAGLAAASPQTFPATGAAIQPIFSVTDARAEAYVTWSCPTDRTAPGTHTVTFTVQSTPFTESGTTYAFRPETAVVTMVIEEPLNATDPIDTGDATDPSGTGDPTDPPDTGDPTDPPDMMLPSESDDPDEPGEPGDGE